MDIRTEVSTGHGAGEPADELAPDDFLFIGELAKKTGADPKTIRFYERAELLAPHRHGRFRTYLASDVRRLKNVLMLRKMGVPIARIRDLFSIIGADTDILSDVKAANLLRTHLDNLMLRQVEVNDQITQTSRALDKLVA